MSEHSKTGRRSFFAGLGLAVTAGVAAKLSTPSVTAVVEPAKGSQGTGYRLTEHIRKYYRTTTI